ncbi:MAG: precorrin-8X methylmutase [Peptococcaceae bacterium]|nr:precorrin-8X methylmutase [Peptococcaceae bacterium]
MAIIEECIPFLAKIPEGERAVIKRIIHTTGDLAIAENIKISSGAVTAGIAAIKAGRSIMTDVNMLRVGINSGKLKQFAIDCFCLINDPEVLVEAKEKGITRAMAAISKGANLADGGIIAIGNAPTALFTLCKMIDEGRAKPALVVGTPVGFVGAAESKEILVRAGIEYITITGNRGGSNIAASVINALLLQA